MINLQDELIISNNGQGMYEITNNINDPTKVLLQATEVRRTYNEQLENMRELRISEELNEIGMITIDPDLYNITKLVHFFTITEEDKINDDLVNNFNKLLDLYGVAI